ncbi:SDR family oxidoreductase [Aggregatimonas sangjinii]|uniref:SDR family oxidoreductase n=1 Tax=Aggregatimonas sangjinii TaxID=2583587 RepID=A0A5B7SLJ6_9FLAO|nr:NAD(P)-binding oxidoreductase [Aggregatimonas sangjinii]QCW99454.1 SDR family oxidoreductase [Aggregatimonas sangjinii]
MNVLIIGATGNVGQHTVDYALKNGHTVTAFGRSVEKIENLNPNLTIYKGDVTKLEDVQNAMQHQDVAILTFGAPLNKDTLFNVPDLCEKGTLITVEAMKGANVPRLICMTAIGAGDSKGHGRFIFRNIIEPVLLGRIMEDRTRQEEIVRNSQLPEWSIIRPTELSNDESSEVRFIKDLENEKEPETISRKDVGRVLANLITDKRYDKQTILITN